MESVHSNHSVGFLLVILVTYFLIILLVVWVVCGGCLGNTLEGLQQRKTKIAHILQKHQMSTFSSRGVVLSCSQLAGYIAVEFAFRTAQGMPMQTFMMPMQYPAQLPSTDYPEPPIFAQNPDAEPLNPFRSSGYAKVPQT